MRLEGTWSGRWRESSCPGTAGVEIPVGFLMYGQSSQGMSHCVLFLFLLFICPWIQFGDIFAGDLLVHPALSLAVE